MSYNKYIQILLKDAISRKCKDDQVNINEMCHKYNFISIDINNEIVVKDCNFLNLINTEIKLFI